MTRFSVGLIACALGCVVQHPAAAIPREKVLYSFCSQANCTDGLFPPGGVTDLNGTLYGTTYENGGTVFSLDLKTGTEKTLHSFGSGDDGALPEGGLINVKGTLYGTTTEGGTGNCSCGTVFSVNPETGAETVVYSFQDNGTDGVNPWAGLINVNGTLYGTTSFGGTGGGCYSVYYGCGTVFSLNPDTGKEQVVYSFQGNGADGMFPEAELINVNGTLYGTTPFGGAEICGCGAVFSLNLQTADETVVHSFGGSPDGQNPYAGLINVNGTLYGTTGDGGANCPGNAPPGCGTVFSLNPNTGAETVVYSFCSQTSCTDGYAPLAGLIEVKGTLYGTTEEGGEHIQRGTVFSLDLMSGTETVLYSFHGQHGKGPTGTLINVNGTFYGTTWAGGIPNNYCRNELGDHQRCGTVFSLVP